MIPILLVFLVSTALLVGPYDEQAVLEVSEFGFGWLTAERLYLASRVVHKYLDFLFFDVVLVAILVACGKIRRDPYLIRVATTLLVSGVMAGVSVQVIKLSTGRPRPPLVQKGKAEAWGFIGPTWSTKHRSYPSGHSIVAATACTVLVAAAPRLLPLAILVAGLIGASRVAYNYHFPTDVLHGLALGLVFGYMSANHLRKIRKRLKPRRVSSA